MPKVESTTTACCNRSDSPRVEKKLPVNTSGTPSDDALRTNPLVPFYCFL